MKLTEILDSQPHYLVTKANPLHFCATGEIGKNRWITFVGERDEPGVWYVEFYEENLKTGLPTALMTGSGRELEVFSFVKRALGEIVKRYEPVIIRFTAAESRVPLYKKLITKFKPHEYDLSTRIDDTDEDQKNVYAFSLRRRAAP